MCVCVKSPLSAALGPDHHERLPVLRAEPRREAVQRSLHVLRLDDGQRVSVSQLLQRETLGTLEGVSRQDAAVRVVVGVQRLFDIRRTFPGPAEQLSGAQRRDR